ncbi:MAG: mandelate racemase/muconate lactonizing enzyme family protein [Candidatus Thorarchaeota archaeon]|nr:mandelate racemase/muconate lactonizing enzyme family protein [Candidatus Thorarchaeota archaeon]
MRITSVRTEPIETHLADEGFTTTYGEEPSIRHHVIVKITSENGFTGVGEACPLPFTADDDPVKIQEEIDGKLAPFLIGKDPLNQEGFHELTDQFPDVGGTARTGVDLALYDLVGKIQCVPVYQLLGGLYREHVEIAAVLGIGTPQSIADEAAHQLSEGMKSVKIKVGVDVERDIETLKLVRETVGDSAKIRADANTGYTVKQALKVLKASEDLNLEYLEQPLAVDDYEGFSQLRKSSCVPIMADESVYTYKDAQTLIDYDAVDFFGLKLIKHGGIYQSKRIAKLAEENDIECVIISPWETQIGISAAVHLVLSGSNFNHPHEIAPGSLRVDPFHGLVVDDGKYQPPKGSGLGIT